MIQRKKDTMIILDKREYKGLPNAKIVLVKYPKLNGMSEFVTFLEYNNDSNFHHGRYFESLESAFNNFMQRDN